MYLFNPLVPHTLKGKVHILVPGLPHTSAILLLCQYGPYTAYQFNIGIARYCHLVRYGMVYLEKGKNTILQLLFPSSVSSYKESNQTFHKKFGHKYGLVIKTSRK